MSQTVIAGSRFGSASTGKIINVGLWILQIGAAGMAKSFVRRRCRCFASAGPASQRASELLQFNSQRDGGIIAK